MAIYRKGQDKGRGVYSSNFEESQVGGWDSVSNPSPGAYPGPKPGTTVERSVSIDVSRVDDVYQWPDGTDPSWHVQGGFSGRVQRTGKGFTSGGSPANNHPSKGTTETARDPFAGRVGKSYGSDSGSDPNQGSGPAPKFKWQ